MKVFPTATGDNGDDRKIKPLSKRVQSKFELVTTHGTRGPYPQPLGINHCDVATTGASTKGLATGTWLHQPRVEVTTGKAGDPTDPIDSGRTSLRVKVLHSDPTPGQSSQQPENRG